MDNWVSVLCFFYVFLIFAAAQNSDSAGNSNSTKATTQPPAPAPPLPTESPIINVTHVSQLTTPFDTEEIIDVTITPPKPSSESPKDADLEPTVTTTETPYQEEDPCPVLKPNMDSLTQEQFSSKLTAACRYDKLIKPPSNDSLPVYIQIDLRHIESADQLQFRAHMLIQYVYRDHRLRFEHISPSRENLLGEELLRNKIWVPHIYIRNERDTTIMGIDGKDIFVSISPKGDVVYSYRLAVTFYCWMQLQKFPFDSQDCAIRWNSWTYNVSNLILHWDPDLPVKIAKNLHLTEFVLSGTSAFEYQTSAPFTKGSFVGNFSELVFHFKISREVGYYIMDYFLPSILLVCTSWVTFWLQADASAPRVALGTATMLAFITLNGGLTKNLPKVSYIKASEIWFLGCAFFIFCSMAEFAFVNVIWRRKKRVELKEINSRHILKGALTPSLARKQLRKAESIETLHKTHSCTSLDRNNEENNKNVRSNNYLTVHSFPSIPTIKTDSKDDLVENEDSVTTIPIPDSSGPPQPQKWHSMTPHEVAMWIDKKSRIVFPITFIIFNIFYWSFVYVL